MLFIAVQTFDNMEEEIEKYALASLLWKIIPLDDCFCFLLRGHAHEVLMLF